MPDCKKAELRIDWATHAAAKYACENWHYSGCMPACKLVKVGVWEGGKFIGVVLFGLGAGNSTNGTAYGLRRFGDVAELVRVALTKHVTPVSKIVAISIRLLAKTSSNLRLLVSFADTEQGHHGGIYQAGGWLYTGTTAKDRKILVRGEVLHPRSAISKYGKNSISWLVANVDPRAKSIKTSGKHRYLMPLNADMRARIMPLAKPYPKRAKQAMDDNQSSQRQGGTDPHAPNQEAG